MTCGHVCDFSIDFLAQQDRHSSQIGQHFHTRHTSFMVLNYSMTPSHEPSSFFSCLFFFLVCSTNYQSKMPPFFFFNFITILFQKHNKYQSCTTLICKWIIINFNQVEAMFVSLWFTLISLWLAHNIYLFLIQWQRIENDIKVLWWTTWRNIG